MVAARKVVVSITEAGSAAGRGAEGLRAALGLARSFEGHQVKVLFRGDGVQWLLPPREESPGPVRAMLGHLYAAGIPCFVEAEALGEAAVGNGVQVVDAQSVRGLVDAADACLNY